MCVCDADYGRHIFTSLYILVQTANLCPCPFGHYLRMMTWGFDQRLTNLHDAEIQSRRGESWAVGSGDAGGVIQLPEM